MQCVTADTDCEIDTLPTEAYPVLHKLAGKWPDIFDAHDLTLKPVKGAMTNHIYECKWAGQNGKRSRKVLVRIYGDNVDIFFRREDEVLTFEFMSRKGQGPLLLGRFPNGRVEEFLHARTLTAADLRDPIISMNIAAKMWEFHQLQLPGGPHEPMLWRRLRDWIQKAKRLCNEDVLKEFDITSMEQEISELEKQCRNDEVIGLCHNDLQYGNIMIDEEGGSLTIIDYEYASYNPVAFDIANHFSEMAADYHSEVPHRLDYTKYPDYDERAKFVQAYLRTSGNPVTKSEMEALLKDVEFYEVASHIHWCIWGMISAQISDIEFDFVEYARQRLDRYHELKKTYIH